MCFADIDECETSQAACAHSCHNNHGSFTCLCNPGYELGSDGRKCYRKSGHISLALQKPKKQLKIPKIYKTGPVILLFVQIFKLHGNTQNRCPCISFVGIEMEIINSCENRNGGCSHQCQHSTVGAVCSCNHGYHLAEDLKTCVGKK